MGISKINYGNRTLIDLTADTVTSDKLAAGTTAHDKAGNAIVGTMKNNGSVTAVMDGLSSVSVTVPAGYTSGGNISLSNDIYNALAEI